MEILAKLVVVVCWGLLAWIGVAMVASVPTWLLWNGLMPTLFSLPRSSLLQTFGLLLLAGMFFTGTAKVSFDS